MMRHVLGLVCVVLMSSVLAVTCKLGAAEGEPELRERLKDEHADGTDLWIYNDLDQARIEARLQNKPIFVTFRCVPCQDCMAFDAEVAQGKGAIDKLAREKFISVRQVEMKDVDLSQFQFDYDLNWAAMFINADGTVYARYGTQSAAGPDAYNSVEGLVRTMDRVLELHRAYPANAAELAGKRGEPKPYKSAIEMPGLPNKEKYQGLTTRQNCIHCHNIHDAEHFQARDEGTYSHDMLWRYPLPDNVGLKIDPADGVTISSVQENSPAAKAGLQSGRVVTHMNGQAIASIADMQWVLNGLPNEDTSVEVQTDADGKRQLSLAKGWKRSDFSWRGSMWSVPPRLTVWMPPLTEDERVKHNIPDGQSALLVRWINRDEAPGQEAYRAGLREGDVIVGMGGQKLPASHPEFNMRLKLDYKVGDKLPLAILRNGERRQIEIDLVE